jgi:hypothetical protein
MFASSAGGGAMALFFKKIKKVAFTEPLQMTALPPLRKSFQTVSRPAIREKTGKARARG